MDFEQFLFIHHFIFNGKTTKYYQNVKSGLPLIDLTKSNLGF